MSRITFRVPGNLSVPTRFFGRFTAKDLIRIGFPLLIAGVTVSGKDITWTTAAVLLTAATLSAVWYGFRPYQQPLDSHVYHLFRWLYRVKYQPPNSHAEERSDYVLVDDEEAVGVIQVDPTNLEMKTEAEQAALHSIYQNLFNTVNYPIQIHSQQQDINLDEYIEHIENQDGVNQLKDDYLHRLERLGNNELTATHHYITIHVNQDSVEWLQQKLPHWIPGKEETDTEPDTDNLVNELDSRIHEVIDAVNTADLNAERVTGQKLEQFYNQLRARPFNPSATESNTPEKLWGEHRYTVYIDELPSNIDLAWPLQLLRVNGQVDITQVVHPKSSAETSKKLQRLSQKLNAEIDSLLRHGYHGTNKLERLLDNTEWFQNLLADRQDQPVEHGVYITAHHPEEKTAQQTFEQICNRLDTLQISYKQPVLRTDQAHDTTHPLQSDPLDETRLIPTRSAAAGFPFATQNTDNNQGIIYGLDTSDQTPVLADRFQWSSHSMARMGMVGSGKSYAVKQELLRSHLAYDNLQIIIVDPKKEYGTITRRLNGETQVLGEETSLDPGEHDVLNYTVDERGQEENTALLVDAVRDIYRFTSQDRRQTLVLIDEARILLNDEQGRDVLNQFVLEARDTQTAVSLVTQNASHFTYHRKGREILDNMPGKIFMRHDRVPNSVTDYFDLSTREKQELYELKTGTDSPYSEAILKITGKLDTRIRIESTPTEHVLIQNSGGNSQ
jgi:type IV secretory pathway VirB4 component